MSVPDSPDVYAYVVRLGHSNDYMAVIETFHHFIEVAAVKAAVHALLM